MIHDSRIIPVVSKDKFAELEKTRWPANVRTWMGQSLGYWDDENTLVVVNDQHQGRRQRGRRRLRRGPSPLNMATMGVPPNNTIPTSDEAKVTEHFTMTGPNSIMYEVTYSDPKVFTAPWTARFAVDAQRGLRVLRIRLPRRRRAGAQLHQLLARRPRGLKTSLVGAHNPEERGGAILTEE